MHTRAHILAVLGLRSVAAGRLTSAAEADAARDPASTARHVPAQTTEATATSSRFSTTVNALEQSDPSLSCGFSTPRASTTCARDAHRRNSVQAVELRRYRSICLTMTLGSLARLMPAMPSATLPARFRFSGAVLVRAGMRHTQVAKDGVRYPSTMSPSAGGRPATRTSLHPSTPPPVQTSPMWRLTSALRPNGGRVEAPAVICARYCRKSSRSAVTHWEQGTSRLRRPTPIFFSRAGG